MNLNKENLVPLYLVINGEPCAFQGLTDIYPPASDGNYWCLSYDDGVQIMVSGAVDFRYRKVSEKKPVAQKDVVLYRCQSCGFEDTTPLRYGVNNHWRKGYDWPTRPLSNDSICYSSLVRVVEEKP